MTDGVTVHNGIAYANHDGVELLGDLYLPKYAKAAPALVAVHGGGWVAGVRAAFQYWAPISPGAASRSLPFPIGSRPKPRPFPKRCRTCSPACNSPAARRARLASIQHASASDPP